MRWLVAPPMRVAYFSSTRSPGVVLRVSRISVLVPSTALTYFAVNEAMPLRCCRKLRATRSALSMARAGPKSRATIWSSWTFSPSLVLASNWMRSSTSLKTRSATGSPATTPSCLQTILPRQVISGGRMASLVRSPSPTSSARATRISGSRCSGASGSVCGESVAVKAWSSVLLHDPGAEPALVALREVGAQVSAARFGPGLGGGDDERRGDGGGAQGHLVEPLGPVALMDDGVHRFCGGVESGGVAHQAGALPHGGAQALGERGDVGGGRGRPHVVAGDGGNVGVGGRLLLGVAVQRRGRGPMGEDHRFQQAVTGQAVGTVHARAGHLAAGVEPGHRGGPAEVGAHAADQVVRGRGDGDALVRDVDAELQAG